MSTGQYTHRTRNAGEIVTAELYNGAHANQRANDIPTSCGAHSDDLTEFQATTDPAPAGVATPVVSLGEELEQLRFVIDDIKTALNDGTPPTEWYTPTPFDATSFQARGARVSRTLAQAISDATLSAIQFTTVAWDTGVALPTFDPFFSLSNQTRLTARATGIYQINGNIEWQAGGGSGVAMRVAIRVNGTTNIASTAHPEISGGARFQEVGTQFLLNNNDYVELVVFHNTGGSLNVAGGAQFALELLSLSAAYTPLTLRTLSITHAGTGTGTVTGTSPSVINCPGVCSEQFVDGTTVELTATPTLGNFEQWTGDVPAPDQFTNPLTLTMDQDRAVVVNWDAFISGFLFMRATGGNLTMTTTNQYASLSQDSILGTTFGAVYVRAPGDFRLVGMNVLLGSAIGGAGNGIFQITLNDVDDAGLVTTIASGGATTGSATGLITVAQDDLLCVRFTVTGTVTTAAVEAISFEVEVAV